MTDIAKIFMTGRSQAVRLPFEYRFTGEAVFIRRDLETGNVILSHRPETWEGFFAVCDEGSVPEDFLRESLFAPAVIAAAPVVVPAPAVPVPAVEAGVVSTEVAAKSPKTPKASKPKIENGDLFDDMFS